MTVPRICGTCNHIHTGRCPTRTQRYGRAHQAERARWEPIVLQGATPCARGDWYDEPHTIDPTEAWHLDHINGQSLPSCARHNDRHSGR